jgi:hypothetical protein
VAPATAADFDNRVPEWGLRACSGHPIGGYRSRSTVWVTLPLMQPARYPETMSEPAPTPIELPPKSAEELAEIRALHERIRQGDFTGTVEWEEVAAELGLPSAAHRAGPSPAS